MLYGWYKAATDSNNLYKTCVQVIRRNDIRFTPSSSQGSNLSSQMPEFTEHVHERVAMLAQMVSSEVWVYIASRPGDAGLLKGHIRKHDVTVRHQFAPGEHELIVLVCSDCTQRFTQLKNGLREQRGTSRINSDMSCRSVLPKTLSLDY